MSLRDADNRGPGSTCEQLVFVSRLAVHNPTGLNQEPWATHLRTCDLCRQEAAEHARSISIYRMLERERLGEQSSSLSWEALAEGIERQESLAHHQRRFRWGIPAAAVAAGALALTIAVGWDGWNDGGAPAPARIVRVQPHEQRTMEQVVRWTLEASDPGGDPLRTASEGSSRIGSLDTEWAMLGAPDNRELAASVSPLQPDSSLTAEDRLADSDRPISVSGHASSVGAGVSNAPAGSVVAKKPIGQIAERRQPIPATQPASNRYGRAQPLYRLEHHFSMQPISFASQD